MKALGLALLLLVPLAANDSFGMYGGPVTGAHTAGTPTPAVGVVAPLPTVPVISSKLPIFPLKEWLQHPGGPMLSPYFLQSQYYEMEIELAEVPTTRDKVDATMKLSDRAGFVLISTPIKIKLRGYTSMNFDKKQFGISLVDKDGEDKEASLLGMPAAEDWVLSAPYNDKSLLRDILAYNLSNMIGRHAPRTRIVRLTMTVDGQLPEGLGIYVLTEKNDIGPGRIPIPKKNKEGTSFVAAFDHTHEGDVILWSGRETDLLLDYPSMEKVKTDELEEFMEKFNDVEERVTYASGHRWETIFDDLLDLDSAVDFFVIQELTRNIDAYRLSSNIYIPPKGKIHFGPIWDFNIAFGNAAHENGVQFYGWRALEKGVWFTALFHHPVFCNAVKDRWIRARWDGTLSNNTIFNIIDKQALVMAPLTAENFARWPSLGRYLWPNPYWLETWGEEIDALKSWISLRTQWMDDTIRHMDCRGDPPY